MSVNKTSYSDITVKVTNDFNITEQYKRYILPLNSGGRVKVYMNSKIFRDINKYVPIKTGKLRRSAVISKDTIKWTAPYSARVFENRFISYESLHSDKKSSSGSNSRTGGQWTERYLEREEQKIASQIMKMVKNPKNSR